MIPYLMVSLAIFCREFALISHRKRVPFSRLRLPGPGPLPGPPPSYFTTHRCRPSLGKNIKL